MSIRPYRDVVRRRSRRVMVGSVPVGGDSPITVQTMTNTLTADAAATIATNKWVRPVLSNHRIVLRAAKNGQAGSYIIKKQPKGKK